MLFSKCLMNGQVQVLMHYSCEQILIHSPDKYFQCIHHVPGTVLGLGDTVMTKMPVNPCPRGVDDLLGRRQLISTAYVIWQVCSRRKQRKGAGRVRRDAV